MDHRELQSLPDLHIPLSISREAGFLIDVLASNGSTEEPASLDWDQLLALAESHGVLPAFCRGYAGPLPEAFRESLRGHWVTAALLTTELSRLLRLFERDHLDVIPLKGPVLADSLYGSKSLRICDDLDLLVKLEDFARAQDLLIGAGFVLMEEEGNYHRTFVGNDVLVELHFAVASPAFPRFDLDGAWARSESGSFDNQPIRCFERRDLLLYLVLHGVKHHFSKLLWLLDITCALKDMDEIEADALLAMARAAGTEGAVLTSCYLANLLFRIDLAGPIEAAISLLGGMPEQGQLLAEKILAGPATDGTPTQNVALFVDLESGFRRRWAHRFRFLIATQQDRLWARHHGIPIAWIRYLRPIRLLFRHGPAIAMRTVFPSSFPRSGTAKRKPQPVVSPDNRPVSTTDG